MKTGESNELSLLLYSVEIINKDYIIISNSDFFSHCNDIKGCAYYFPAYQGVDESGANSFKVLFPSGTPLPARRQHTLQAPGSISSVCLELYESEGKNSAKVENKFAQVNISDYTMN